MFSGEIPFKISHLFFLICGERVFAYCILSILIDTKSLIRYMICKYFHSACGLSFHFDNSAFQRGVLKFNEVQFIQLFCFCIVLFIYFAEAKVTGSQFLLEILYYNISHFGLWSILSSFCICWKDHSFSTDVFLHLFQKSIDHIHMALFLDYIWFHWSNVFLDATTTTAPLLQFNNKFWGNVSPPILFLFFLNCFGYFAYFAFPYNFYN